MPQPQLRGTNSIKLKTLVTTLSGVYNGDKAVHIVATAGNDDLKKIEFILRNRKAEWVLNW